ncbi:hypothetical protein A8709_04695 [Paenibacillus pectinilyticus]|uniref:Uncharacterized protein n=1 Tax=Paenibacillus pectinilyticus TaxID=512399 RepID=A0A1C0ZSF1_9BACL|nr:hypothetical protein [Paenibacillus pectinilyticus]OCT11005.1 hypothetical protein A8709_04695 [Paenibacillus pectinilyticus]
MKLAVFYDFHEEGIHPFLMALRFRPHELDFSKSTLYIPIHAPFQQLQSTEILDTEAGITVLLEDLIINPAHPASIGISLSHIKQRHIQLRHDLPTIQQLWIRMTDIEEVLQMDIRSFYSWVSK